MGLAIRQMRLLIKNQIQLFSLQAALFITYKHIYSSMLQSITRLWERDVIMRKYFVFLVIFPILVSLACTVSLNNSPTAVPTIDKNELATIVASTLAASQQNPTNPDGLSPPEQSTPVQDLPTLTLIPSLTPTITSSPTPAGNPEASLGKPDWKNTFTDGNEGFYDDDDEYTIITANNGKLFLESTMKIRGWHGWSMHHHKIDNYYLEAVINLQNCGGQDEYGIIFRGPDYSNGYFYGLTCNGKYSLRTHNAGKYQAIVDWSQSPVINSGANQTNKLGLLVNGNQISLYVNDQLLQQASADQYNGKGTFGVFIAAYETPGFTYALDEIAYWLID
jgi:hypothetical protein